MAQCYLITLLLTDRWCYFVHLVLNIIKYEQKDNSRTENGN